MSATQTIVWMREGARNGGHRVPEGSGIPRFKGRRNVKPSVLAAELEDALSDLARTPCAFWACAGPGRVQYMCTCCKCYAMRTVEKVRAALARMEEV